MAETAELDLVCSHYQFYLFNKNNNYDFCMCGFCLKCFLLKCDYLPSFTVTVHFFKPFI